MFTAFTKKFYLWYVKSILNLSVDVYSVYCNTLETLFGYMPAVAIGNYITELNKLYEDE